jgi:hypothetical protein
MEVVSVYNYVVFIRQHYYHPFLVRNACFFNLSIWQSRDNTWVSCYAWNLNCKLHPRASHTPLVYILNFRHLAGIIVLRVDRAWKFSNEILDLHLRNLRSTFCTCSPESLFIVNFTNLQVFSVSNNKPQRFKLLSNSWDSHNYLPPP